MSVWAGRTWENNVAEYFKKKGYRVEVRVKKGSHEIDLWAEREGEVVACQCKYFADNRAVGPDVVRAWRTVCQDLKVKPALAYTSKLTKLTRELAKEYGFLLLNPMDVTIAYVEELKAINEGLLELLEESRNAWHLK